MRRRSTLVALAVTGVLALAGTAGAAGAIKGATYSGRLRPEAGVPLSDGMPIALQVSPSGTSVTVQMGELPLFCQGGLPPQIVKFKPARIKGGKFRTTGTETTEAKFGGGLTATATVTGKFDGDKAKGSFEVKYVKATSCNGQTGYTATNAAN